MSISRQESGFKTTKTETMETQLVTQTELKKSLSMTQFEIGSQMGEAVILASQGEKLKDSNDFEIKKLIGYIFALIGLKTENLPSDFQKAVIINFMRSDLGNWTAEEVKQAFHLLAGKKLDMDSKHYQNFSAIYLGEVMQAYQKVKQSAYKDFRIGTQKAEELSKPKPDQSQQKADTHDFIRECIIKPWNYYLKTGTITFGIMPWNIVYRHFNEVLGLLDMSVSEKKEIHAEAIKMAKSSISKVTFDKTEFNKIKILKEQIEQIGFMQAMDYPIKQACYEISVKRFLEKCKTDGIDLEAQIENWIENDKKS